MAIYNITNSLITNSGLSAILSAGLSGPQVELTGFQIGSSSAAQGQTIAATDTAITNVVYTGTLSQISYTVSADGNSGNFLITLDETVGNFECGIIGLLMGSGTLFAEALLLQQEQKLASNPPSSIGNVKLFSIGLLISNIAECINLTILNSAYASLPEVATELVLPSASSATYSVYMVQNQTTIGRPGLAYRVNSAWYIETLHLTPNQGNGVITVVPTLIGSTVGLNMAVYWDSTTSKYQPSDPANPKTYPTGICTSTYEITTVGMIVHQTGDVWPGTVTPGTWYYVQTGANVGQPGTSLTFLPYGFCIDANRMIVNFDLMNNAYQNYIPGTTSIIGTPPYGQPLYIGLATDSSNGLESAADKASFDSFPVVEDAFGVTLATLSPEHDGGAIEFVITNNLGPDFDIGTQVPNEITIKQGVFIGNGAPASGFGSNGQYYIDRHTANIWGPKTSGAWGSSPIYWGNNRVAGVSGNNTLTAYNQFVEIGPNTGATTSTTTLLTPVSAANWWYIVLNDSNVNQILASGGGQFVQAGQTNSSTLTLVSGQIVTLVSDGSNWLYTSSNMVPIATTTSYGIAREATSLEASNGVTTGPAPAFITPEEFAAIVLPVATTTMRGIVREATSGECTARTTSGSVPAFVTPENLPTNTGPAYTVSSTAPSSPNVLDQWFSTTDNQLYEYIYDGTGHLWLQINPASGGGSPPVATTTSYGIAREATTGEASAGVTSGIAPAFITPEELAAAIATVNNVDLFTITGVGALANISYVSSGGTGAGDPYGWIQFVGGGSTFTWGSPGIAGTYYSQTAVATASSFTINIAMVDLRWPTNSAPPGTWKALSSGLVSSSTNSSTGIVQRIS